MDVVVVAVVGECNGVAIRYSFLLVNRDEGDVG